MLYNLAPLTKFKEALIINKHDISQTGQPNKSLIVLIPVTLLIYASTLKNIYIYIFKG